MKKLTDSQKKWVIIANMLIVAAIVFILSLLDRNVLGVILSSGCMAWCVALLYRRYPEAWRHPASDLEWEVYACPEPGRNPFSITEVRYRRLASFGNYENEAVEMAARVYPGDDPDDVLAALRERVRDKLAERGAKIDRDEELHDLDRQLAAARNELAFAREKLEKAKAFLKQFNIELYGDPPF